MRCARHLSITVLACTYLISISFAAGDPGTDGVLRLRTGDVHTAALPNLLNTGATPAFEASRRFVVQLDGPLSRERRAALEAAGVKLGDYLPTHAFVADLTQASRAGLSQLTFVKWVGEYQRAWRIDPEIGTRAFATPERQTLAAADLLALTVYLFDGEPLEPTLAAIAQLEDARVQSTDQIGTQPLINLVLPARALPHLADLAAVQFVEEYPEFTPRNSTDRWIVQSNVADLTPLYDDGLHGEGQVLGHIDGRMAVTHCSFYDSNPIGPNHRKILAYNTSLGYDLHGTHTAGTAVGDAGAWSDTRGVAYLAKLVFNTIPSMNESQMYARFDLHRTQGATVHTNSWGNDGTTQYDGACRAIDNISWLYDDQLICFAVTNMSSLKNPENAKNVLAVGASRDTPNQHQHCSGGAGPTADGRRKPEIYAPGCSTMSSSGNGGCGTTALTGTSMACPAIAGTALLVRQYFTDGYYPAGLAEPLAGFVPTGALVKAALLNSAVDMTGIAGYPSNSEGWGRVLADNALYFAGDLRSLVVYDYHNNTPDALSTGEAVIYNVAVTGASEQLRVTLVWHDYPGAVNSQDPVVNNLDLLVTSPSGTAYKGNVFTGGVSVPGGNADPENNVEQVHITTPETGTWVITVTGTAVNQGTQGYALVVTGEVVDLMCPTVSTDPASQAVTEGGTVAFSVVAGGGGPQTYAWRKDGVPLIEGGRFAGVHSANLTLTAVEPADTGSYDVVVTNACGSTASAAAALSVWQRGDLNCDGTVNFADINAFVQYVTDCSAWQAANPGCAADNGDVDADGQDACNGYPLDDVNAFVALLSGT